MNAWKASAPAARVTYTEQEKAAQRQAGTAALRQMYAALDGDRHSYTFPPGVYRFTGARPFDFENRANFTICAAHCTFIMENMTAGLFMMNKCSHMAILGPLVLDADPLRFSQAEVMRVDEKTGVVEIKVMPGYPMPPEKSRLMIFGPDGIGSPLRRISSGLFWTIPASSGRTNSMEPGGSP